MSKKITLLSFIIPTYDEITLFAMGFACGLLLLTGAFSIHWKEATSTVNEDIGLLFITAFFLSGHVLSIYQAFTDRPKTEFEKTLIIIFAVILNGFTGILAGTYMLEEATGWLMIFPILNIVNGAFLLVMLRSNAINGSNVSDEHAPLSHVVMTGTLVVILFIVCHYVLELLWVQTLTICVAYSTNINNNANNLISRLWPTLSSKG